MTFRMSDMVARYVEAAIQGLDVPEAVKRQVEYEVMPMLALRQPKTPFSPPEQELTFLIGIGLPTMTGDHHIQLHPLDDPHDQAEVQALVGQLFTLAQKMVEESDSKIRAVSNGHKKTEGGLILPQ